MHTMPPAGFQERSPRVATSSWVNVPWHQLAKAHLERSDPFPERCNSENWSGTHAPLAHLDDSYLGGSCHSLVRALRLSSLYLGQGLPESNYEALYPRKWHAFESRTV